MSEPSGTQTSTVQRPDDDNKEAWIAYWKAQDQPWRTEPEIDHDRQIYFEELLDKEFFIIQAQADNEVVNTYPFEGIQLSRGDIEWLLATYKDGTGLMSINVAVYFRLKGSGFAYFQKGLNLGRTDLRKVNLMGLPLEKVDFTEAHLEGASFSQTQLEGAIFSDAHLQDTWFFGTHLEKANFCNAHLEGACFAEAHLQGSNLSYAFCSGATNLRDVLLSDEKHGAASLGGIRWGDADLTVIEWGHVDRLGEEQWACKLKNHTEKNRKIWKGTPVLINAYRTAVRANRQLAVALRDQGLNEEADHFAYRAQVLQREVLHQQHRWLKCVFSWLFYLLAGYGYRPFRSVAAYLFFILGFAVAFYTLGHLAWYEALVISLTAFHGRGFFSQQYQPGDPQSIIAAIEAVVGLLIEISFIATFTQRFFGR